MGKLPTKKLILIAAGILILVVAAYFLTRSQDSNLLLYQTEKIQLSIKDTYLSVEVSDSLSEQAQGLSGRQTLASGEGMLFVYERPTVPSFWMKDMKFSIDIIWIGKDRRVAEITANITPETYPQAFQPSNPVQYVLEVTAGFAERHSLKVGDAVYW